VVVHKIESITTLDFGLQLEKFRQRMVVNNFSVHTISSYIAAIKRLQEHYNRPLESLQEDNLVGFVCNLKENYGLSVSSMRIAIGAIKYFYRHILQKETLIDKIPFPKKEQRISTILTGSEVKRLLDLTIDLKHRLILKILYSAGLRRSEVMNLRCEDFDWKKHAT